MMSERQLNIKCMKKICIAVMGLWLTLSSKAQHIRGSLQRGTAITSVDILFRPTYNSDPGEYINYIQFSLAIPQALSVNVNAYITGVGNFATLTFVQAPQYTQGIERIYTWICNNPGATVMSWFTNTEFIGATVTFNGNPSASALVRMLDLTNTSGPGPGGGGGNNNTFFSIVSSTGDVTDYAEFFYDKPGPNGSMLGVYPSGDQFVQTLLAITLPADELDLSGYKDGSRNRLLWTTLAEQNNIGFEVQRSSDGVSYVPIGFMNSLAAGGNSQVPLKYTFTDNDPTGKRQYYRLRQVDIGGNSKLSNIVLIKSDNPALITLNGFFPNPATTTINMMIGSPGKDKITAVVFDMTGKTVLTKSLNVETGNNTIPLEIAALAGGNYMIKLISSNGQVVTGRFVKH